MNKIVIIITRGDTIGGAQSHVITLCEGLLSRKLDVELIVGGKNNVLSNLLSGKGVPIHHIPSLNREINFLFDFIALLHLIKLFIKIKPDVVSLHSSKAGLIGRLSCKLCGIPCVFTAHGWAFTEGAKETTRFIYMVLEKLLGKITKKVIAVSNYDFNLAVKYNVCVPPKLVQIYNGIDDYYNERPLRINSKIIELVMVARFDIPKDQMSLIEAVVPLNNVRLNLVGDGPNLIDCRNYVNKMKIQEKVIFHGFVPNVREVIKNMDIFILISNYEGFPISTIEAMSLGMPVVISNVGGAGEAVINSQNGYLVENNDLNSISDAVNSLLNNPKLIDKMGLKSREFFLKSFGAPKMIDSTIKVFEEAFYDL